ncbi:MAG: 30S ribosomal protein S16 [Planctomycetes bacterium]|nr:30S ribosomal protein S16 [Planctomycetota bacterium]
MSVAIRLSRAGRVHLPYYHIGVYNSRTRRDGRPVEQLGFYDPKSDKETVRIDLERAKYWLSVGAKPSATVATILKQQGLKTSDWTPKKDMADKAKKSAAKKASAKKSAEKKAKPAAKARKPRTASSKARGEKAAKSAG